MTNRHHQQSKFMRFFKHMLSMPWHVHRRFSKQSLDHIEHLIGEHEHRHAGEIRFVVEAGLHPIEVLYDKTPKERAIELFGRLNIWDTEHNNGVLIYLLLADRDVEIVADRGIHRLVGDAAWEEICHNMELQFKEAAFEAGVLYGVEQISLLLEQHFPLSGQNKNELPNRPIIL